MSTEPTADRVAQFYERHPYPPQLTDLDRYADDSGDTLGRRFAHHLLWPFRPYQTDVSILVAGCGTSQAAKYAIRHPGARVVGIDLSPTSLDHTRALATRHELDNLELHLLPIEHAGSLDTAFDHIVCTGVLHHLADPDAGLRALAESLDPDGALTLMLYAPYGRTGVHMIQDYCRRLGIGTSPSEIDDLVRTLRELPMGHPISHRLRNTPDFQDPDALADALLHPRERSYSVPELFDFIDRADLEFGRWVRQAPYLPSCGSLSAVPHGERVSRLPIDEQFAALELFRGTMVRHSLIALHRDRHATGAVRFDGDEWRSYVPIPVPTATVVRERLPEGAAAALLNRAHEFTDLVLFVDHDEMAMFASMDGATPLGEISGIDPGFAERLWAHDLVVVDASARPERTHS